MTKLASEGDGGVGEGPRATTTTRASGRGSTGRSSSSTATSQCFPPADDPYDVAARRLRARHEDRRGAARLRPAQAARSASSSQRRRRRARGRFVGGAYPAGGAARAVARRSRARSAPRTSPSASIRPSTRSAPRSRRSDVRLTTRYAENDLHGNSLFSTMHEVGHGLYEHGGDPALDRTPLATGCSSALHESQSRLWENVIGRSLPFWRWFYPQFRDAFASDARRRPARAVPPRDQPRAPVAHPRRRRRDDVRAPHHPPLRARAGAPVRRALDRRPARGVEREARGAARHPAADKPLGLPPGRPLVGRAVRLLPDLPARQRPLGADLGAAARRPPRRVRAGRARLVRRDLRVAPRRALPARAQVHARRRRSSGSPAARSTRSRTSATSRTRTPRSPRRSAAGARRGVPAARLPRGRATSASTQRGSNCVPASVAQQLDRPLVRPTRCGRPAARSARRRRRRPRGCAPRARSRPAVSRRG